jgi:hypothetical protein
MSLSAPSSRASEMTAEVVDAAVREPEHLQLLPEVLLDV